MLSKVGEHETESLYSFSAQQRADQSKAALPLGADVVVAAKRRTHTHMRALSRSTRKGFTSTNAGIIKKYNEGLHQHTCGHYQELQGRASVDQQGVSLLKDRLEIVNLKVGMLAAEFRTSFE
jgi:hypothetical protein